MKTQTIEGNVNTINKVNPNWGKSANDNLGTRTGATEASFTNRIQGIEERLWGIEDMDTLVKENVISEKISWHKTSRKCGTLWSNLRITGVEQWFVIFLRVKPPCSQESHIRYRAYLIIFTFGFITVAKSQLWSSREIISSLWVRTAWGTVLKGWNIRKVEKHCCGWRKDTPC